MKVDLPRAKDTQPERVPSLGRLCREVVALRADLVHARLHLPRPGYHLDLDAAEAGKTARFLRKLPVRTLELQRLIARYREATGREDFDDILLALGLLRRESDQLFSVSGRYWHDALFLPSELLAAAVVAGDQTSDQEC